MLRVSPRPHKQPTRKQSRKTREKRTSLRATRRMSPRASKKLKNDSSVMFDDTNTIYQKMMKMLRDQDSQAWFYILSALKTKTFSKKQLDRLMDLALSNGNYPSLSIKLSKPHQGIMKALASQQNVDKLKCSEFKRDCHTIYLAMAKKRFN